MVSTPTTRLRLEKQALGENLNTWGNNRLNDALDRIDEAVGGVQAVTISGTSTVLTSANYSTDQARKAVLVLTGTLTAASTITVPGVEKLYLVVNNATMGAFSLTIKTAAGSGVSLRSGPQSVYCDATSVFRATPTLNELPVPTADLAMGGFKLTGLGAPSVTTDAATKAYVDSAASSVNASGAAASATAAATSATNSANSATASANSATASATSATAAATSATAAAASAASIAAGPVASINGKTGVVSLKIADIPDAAVTAGATNTGYAVLGSAGTNITLSNGNKTFVNTGTGLRGGRSDIARSTGKWYFEFRIEAGVSTMGFGVTTGASTTMTNTMGSAAGEWGLVNSASDGFCAGSATLVTTVGSFTPVVGDVFGIAVDLGTGSFWASRNGTWFTGDPAAGTSPGLTGQSFGTVYPASTSNGTSSSHTMRLSLSEFSYTPPTGFSDWAPLPVFAGSAATATTLAAGADRTKLDAAMPVSGGTFTKAVRGSIVALTDAATVAVDASLGNYFSVTLGGNRTLGNPTNLVAGQGGSIIITQDGTGSRTLAYGSNWKFAGGTAPVLTTTAGAVDRLDYLVVSGSAIHATLFKDLK